MGHLHWLACFGMDGRNGYLVDADRVGARPQKPPRRAGPASGCRLPVWFSGVACRRSGTCGSLARNEFEIELGAQHHPARIERRGILAERAAHLLARRVKPETSATRVIHPGASRKAA